jgi:hypothetical protein
VKWEEQVLLLSKRVVALDWSVELHKAERTSILGVFVDSATSPVAEDSVDLH